MSGVIVHEWIEPSGGAENVLDQFVAQFPEADVLCLWNDAPNRFPPGTVQESPLARSMLRRSKALSMPLMPLIWRTWQNRDWDWVLVSSHLFAHHIHFRGRAEQPRKLAYIHTPARYLWEPQLDNRGNSPLLQIAARPLRRLDRARTDDSTEYAANSEFVRQRIARVWDRDAAVIYPPVDIHRIASTPDWTTKLNAREAATVSSLPPNFVLGASRFVPYKRLDWVIRAANAAGLPAVIAGSGPDLKRLRAVADEVKVPVHFIDRPSDALLFSLYQRALVYVFPPIEDFGIMPVEALAAGAPVIANRVGGAGESVTDGADGLLFEDDRWESIADLIDSIPQSRYEPSPDLHSRFSAERFRHQIASWVLQSV